MTTWSDLYGSAPGIDLLGDAPTQAQPPTHADWLAARDRRDGAEGALVWNVRMGYFDAAQAAVVRYDEATAEMNRIAAVLDARD